MTTAVTLIAILVTVPACLAAYGYARARRPAGFAILLCGLGLTWAGWAMAAGWRPFASAPDPQIALRSSQWRCAKSHKSQSTALIPAGKVMMPVTTTQQVCDRYERR